MRSFAILLVLAVAAVACERAPSSRAPAASAHVRASADSAGAPPDTAAASAFVRAFYAWYVPQARHATGRPAALVLRERPQALAPSLRQALAAEEAAQDSVTGEIAGLDFDPFLGGHDPCEPYEVGAARLESPAIAVPLYAVCGGQRSAEPAVLATVVHYDDTWQFENFRYPAPGADLQATLRALAADTAR